MADIISEIKAETYKAVRIAKDKITSGQIDIGIQLFELAVSNLLEALEDDGGDSSSSAGVKATGDTETKVDFRQQFRNTVRTFETPLDWNSVIGQEGAKNALKEALIYPSKYAWYFKNGVVPPQGILLYGPPGVAKTKLAEVAASQLKLPFLSVKASDIKSKWSGQAEKMVQALFDEVMTHKRAIIFIDEIDGLLPQRGRSDTSTSADGIVNQFLINVKGVEENDKSWFVIIGATNHPKEIDSAVLRRFQRTIALSLPTCSERQLIFQHYIKENGNCCDSTFKDFAEKTSGYSGSDIKVIVQDALLQPLRDAISSHVNDGFVKEHEVRELQKDDILQAIKRTRKTVTKDDLNKLRSFGRSNGNKDSSHHACKETSQKKTTVDKLAANNLLRL